MGLLKEFFNNNKGMFILAVSVFAIGIVLGVAVACRLGPEETSQLVRQLSDYISGGNATKVSFKQLVVSRCADNLRYILIVLICSRSVYLIPIAAVALGIWGYRLGFAVSFVCGSFGGEGIAITLASSLLSYVLTMPLYILAFVLAAICSPRVRQHGTMRKGDTALLCSIAAVIYGILCLAAVAEGFLIPVISHIICG